MSNTGVDSSQDPNALSVLFKKAAYEKAQADLQKILNILQEAGFEQLILQANLEKIVAQATLDEKIKALQLELTAIQSRLDEAARNVQLSAQKKLLLAQVKTIIEKIQGNIGTTTTYENLLKIANPEPEQKIAKPQYPGLFIMFIYYVLPFFLIATKKASIQNYLDTKELYEAQQTGKLQKIANNVLVDMVMDNLNQGVNAQIEQAQAVVQNIEPDSLSSSSLPPEAPQDSAQENQAENNMAASENSAVGDAIQFAYGTITGALWQSDFDKMLDETDDKDLNTHIKASFDTLLKAQTFDLMTDFIKQLYQIEQTGGNLEALDQIHFGRLTQAQCKERMTEILLHLGFEIQPQENVIRKMALMSLEDLAKIRKVFCESKDPSANEKFARAKDILFKEYVDAMHYQNSANYTGLLSQQIRALETIESKQRQANLTDMLLPNIDEIMNYNRAEQKGLVAEAKHQVREIIKKRIPSIVEGVISDVGKRREEAKKLTQQFVNELHPFALDNPYSETAWIEAAKSVAQKPSVIVTQKSATLDDIILQQVQNIWKKQAKKVMAIMHQGGGPALYPKILAVLEKELENLKNNQATKERITEAEHKLENLSEFFNIQNKKQNLENRTTEELKEICQSLQSALKIMVSDSNFSKENIDNQQYMLLLSQALNNLASHLSLPESVANAYNQLAKTDRANLFENRNDPNFLTRWVARKLGSYIADYFKTTYEGPIRYLHYYVQQKQNGQYRLASSQEPIEVVNVETVIKQPDYIPQLPQQPQTWSQWLWGEKDSKTLAKELEELTGLSFDAEQYETASMYLDKVKTALDNTLQQQKQALDNAMNHMGTQAQEDAKIELNNKLDELAELVGVPSEEIKNYQDIEIWKKLINSQITELFKETTRAEEAFDAEEETYKNQYLPIYSQAYKDARKAKEKTEITLEQTQKIYVEIIHDIEKMNDKSEVQESYLHEMQNLEKSNNQKYRQAESLVEQLEQARIQAEITLQQPVQPSLAEKAWNAGAAVVGVATTAVQVATTAAGWGYAAMKGENAVGRITYNTVSDWLEDADINTQAINDKLIEEGNKALRAQTFDAFVQIAHDLRTIKEMYKRERTALSEAGFARLEKEECKAFLENIARALGFESLDALAYASEEEIAAQREKFVALPQTASEKETDPFVHLKEIVKKENTKVQKYIAQKDTNNLPPSVNYISMLSAMNSVVENVHYVQQITVAAQLYMPDLGAAIGLSSEQKGLFAQFKKNIAQEAGAYAGQQGIAYMVQENITQATSLMHHVLDAVMDNITYQLNVKAKQEVQNRVAVYTPSRVAQQNQESVKNTELENKEKIKPGIKQVK